jgi:hypothetical protein
VENTETKPLKEEKIIKMGKKDNVFTYYSKWPIFILHSLDQEGIWLKLKTKLDILEYQNYLQEVTMKEIEDFLWKNPDIFFETNVFQDMLPHYYFFKYKDQVYLYTSGKKGKDKVKIYARFYFDTEEFI